MGSLHKNNFMKPCDWCESYGEFSDCCNSTYHEDFNGNQICDVCRKITNAIQCYECENGHVFDKDAYFKAKLEKFVNDND